MDRPTISGAGLSVDQNLLSAFKTEHQAESSWASSEASECLNWPVGMILVVCHRGQRNRDALNEYLSGRIDRGAPNQYERGKHEPDFSMVERVAKVLEVPESYFYAKDDEAAWLLVVFHRMSAPDRKEVLALARNLAG